MPERANPKHWLIIVPRVLSDNPSMLGEILSRLTGMTDGTISTCVVIQGRNVCGDVIDLFIS